MENTNNINININEDGYSIYTLMLNGFLPRDERYKNWNSRYPKSKSEFRVAECINIYRMNILRTPEERQVFIDYILNNVVASDRNRRIIVSATMKEQV